MDKDATSQSCTGMWGPYNLEIVDRVRVPKDLPAGKWVLNPCHTRSRGAGACVPPDAGHAVSLCGQRLAGGHAPSPRQSAAHLTEGPPDHRGKTEGETPPLSWLVCPGAQLADGPGGEQPDLAVLRRRHRQPSRAADGELNDERAAPSRYWRKAPQGGWGAH